MFVNKGQPRELIEVIECLIEKIKKTMVIRRSTRCASYTSQCRRAPEWKRKKKEVAVSFMFMYRKGNVVNYPGQKKQ